MQSDIIFQQVTELHIETWPCITFSDREFTGRWIGYDRTHQKYSTGSPELSSDGKG